MYFLIFGVILEWLKIVLVLRVLLFCKILVFLVVVINEIIFKYVCLFLVLYLNVNVGSFFVR